MVYLHNPKGLKNFDVSVERDLVVVSGDSVLVRAFDEKFKMSQFAKRCNPYKRF